MASWQEQLFEAINDGNTSLVTTIIGTEGLDANVNRKVFFSRISYNGNKKTFVYVAQSSAQTSVSMLCSIIGIIYMLSGCIFSFALMAADRQFHLAPTWLTMSTMLVFTPVPFIVGYYILFVVKDSRPDVTMLHAAAWSGQPLVVRLLRTRYGASPSVVDNGKRQPGDVTTNNTVLRELSAAAVS